MSRAVFFDIDGVLVHGMHHNPLHVRRWDTRLLADMGVDPQRFTEEFIFGVFVKKVITGQMSLISALDRWLPTLGYRGSTMTFLNYWLEQDSVLNQPLLDLVATLRRRGEMSLYIATNQEHIRASWLWSHLGLSRLFEDMFHSARVGVRKPDQGFFDFIEQRIGPQDQPPLFFDDTPKVIEGARRAGWEAVLFNTVEDCATHPWVAERVSQPVGG